MEGSDAFKAAILAQARLGLRDADADYLESLTQEARQAIEDITETRKAFNEHMNLAAAVTYWEGKQHQHDRAEAKYLQWTIRSAIAFVLLAIFTPVLIITNGLTWITARLASAPQFETPAFYLILGLYILLLTTGLWGLRVLVKLYLSEHHLRADALERFTMVKTFLALHREGAVDPTDRTIVLSSLFRPSSDGVVRDEGLDPSLPHLLSKALARP